MEYPIVNCESVTKIFGQNPQSIQHHIDEGMSRADILEKTGHVVAVRDVSFTVGRGEFFVVMGLSGSGKSTLIRCLTRLIEPTSGKIEINGQDITKINKQELRELRRHTASMVFQRFGLFPHRRVIDNVAYGLEVQGMDLKERHKISMSTIELVGLSGWEHYYPHELSGGMQQRVGLARALAVEPDILLCDEPFSALDPLIRREMQDELLRLQKMVHKTVIFITHDFLEAIKIGDRIAIMKDGEIVQIGTPQDIIAHPVDDYVREFTQDVPRVKVLTVSNIMNPLNGESGDYPTIEGTLSLEELFGVLSDGDAEKYYVSANDERVGWVDSATVISALAGLSE